MGPKHAHSTAWSPAEEAVQLFPDAYDYARRLNTLRGLTPYEFVCRTWVEQPGRFTRGPTHDTLGPNI